MDFPHTLFITLLCNCLLNIREVVSTEGYTAHFSRNCWGHDIPNNVRVYSVDQCRSICDIYAQCVAFVYSTSYYTEEKCKIKSVCGYLSSTSSYYTVYKKTADRGGCAFESAPEFALYGHNDITLASATVDTCKKKCLFDQKCLSFDYKSKGKMCLLSYDSRDTQPSFYKKHYAMTYYHKICGADVDAVPETVLTASDGGIVQTKDGQCVKTFGPFGKPASRKFDDEDKMNTNITEIGANAHSHINSIRIKYGTVMKTNGASGGTQRITQLNPGEYITGIEGYANSKITKLLFITNQRPIGPFGSSEGKEFSADGNGKRLLYISGSYDYSHLTELNCHFEC